MAKGNSSDIVVVEGPNGTGACWPGDEAAAAAQWGTPMRCSKWEKTKPFPSEMWATMGDRHQWRLADRWIHHGGQ